MCTQKKAIPRPPFWLMYFCTIRFQFFACPFLLVHSRFKSPNTALPINMVYNACILLNFRDFAYLVRGSVKPHTIRNTMLTAQYSLPSRIPRPPPFKRNPISCNDDCLWAKTIPNAGNDPSCSIASTIELAAHRIDIRILPSGLLSSIGFLGWILMASDPRYVKLYSFKSFDIRKWKLWTSSNPENLHTIVNTSYWTSCRPSIKQATVKMTLLSELLLINELVFSALLLWYSYVNGLKESPRDLFLVSVVKYLL